MFMQISLRGAPCFVRPEHVAAVRAAKENEAGTSTLVLSCGERLASPYPVDVLLARLSGQTVPAEQPPAPNSEQLMALRDLTDRLDVRA